MKKPALILLIVITTMLSVFQMACWADEVSEFVSNGDRVSIFGDISVDKNTVGDIVAIFGSIEVNKSVQGDVVSVFGNVNVKDNIEGEVVSVMGDVTLDGSISRDVVIVFGKVKMTENAVVNGDLVTIGTIEREAGAKVFGQEVKVNIAFLMVARTVVTIVLAFLVLILGLVIIAIFKDRAVNISLTVEENIGRKIALGFLGQIGFLIIMILLSIVAIGPLLYLFLLVAAEVVISIYFGKQILKVFNANLNVYLEFITGLATVTLLKILLTLIIPQIGFVPYLIAYVIFDIFIRAWGIGILVDTKFGTSKANSFAAHGKRADMAFDLNLDESAEYNDEK